MSSGPSTSNFPPYPPPAAEALQKKKQRTRWMIIGIILALIGLTSLEVYLIRHGGGTSAPMAGNVAVLLVFNITLILIFALLLLITRNLIKLYNERKSRIIGSRFQTKLILAFLILALFPTILLFIVASKLFSYSIGQWFNLQVQNSLEQSMQVAREYYLHLEKDSRMKARYLDDAITDKRLYLPENRPRLVEFIEEKLLEYNLAKIVLFDPQSNEVISKGQPSQIPVQYDFHFPDLIKKSLDGEEVTELRSTENGYFLMSLRPLSQKVENAESVWGYIVTLNLVPKSSLTKIEALRKTYEGYKQQNLLLWPVSANYYITFLLVTLLILFSAIWLGFYMARGITIPIQQLAEGTRRIAGGDLDFIIDINTTDEIGILVRSFNTMTHQLQEKRRQLQTVNEDLKTSNIELERRRYYIETILENIGAGVVSVDKKGRITTLNKAAQRILKIPAGEFLGFGYKDLFAPSFHEPIRKMIRRMIREERDSAEEQMEIMVGENQLTLLVNIRVLLGQGKKYLGMVIVFEDLTQMIKAQKVAAWREVAQGIAHEIKNPLTPIQLNTQRLRKKYQENRADFDRVFDESINVIIQEVEGMKALLNEFVRFSRMPTPKPKPVSLHKLIDDAANLYSGHDKNVTVKKSYDPNITLINVDGEQIHRVFINLFENAMDAVQPGGNITIHTRMFKQSRKVRVEFSDDGVGIPATDRDKLFLPHFTTKKRGTGLGLAIVHRIIVDHGGTIVVRDNAPRGTTFSIEIPFNLPAQLLTLDPEGLRKTSPPI